MLFWWERVISSNRKSSLALHRSTHKSKVHTLKTVARTVFVRGRTRASESTFVCSHQQQKHFLRSAFVVGGSGWIRTTEVTDNRFTVCPLWPLGNLPIYGAGDWNRTHNLLITNQLLCLLSYASILDVVLYFVSSVVPRGGIEPPTRGFSVPCSTD